MNFIPIDICPDISFWQDDNTTIPKVDFVKMRTQTQGVVIRAGQNTWIDSDVIYNWQAAKEAGLKRGSYWFYDSRSTPQQQADLWKAALGNDLPEWGLWCDLEESYGGAYKGESNWKKFVEAVRVLFPNVKIGIYTANWWWSQQTVTQADYWASFPLWVAQYVSDPAFVTLPAPWVNKGAALWQFSDNGDGLKYGVESLNIDLNYTSQAFYNLFGVVPPENQDVTTYPFDGVKWVSGFRYGWQFELSICDPAKVNMEMVCLSPIETVSSVAIRKNAQIATNGGEWDRVGKLKDYSVSNSSVCQERAQAVPSLMILNDKSVVIDHRATANVRHALSGLRYLIENGQLKAYLYGSEPQYTEGHARAIEGKNSAGHHIRLSSKGVYPNQGLTLKQAALIMQTYGAVTAFDSGGGGDVTVVKNGVSLITPENINPANGQHFERPLPQAMLIYAREEGEPMPETFDYYEYTPKKSSSSDAGNRAIRTAVGVTSPRIASHSDFLFNTKAKGKATAADRVILDSVTAPPLQGDAGDIWVTVYDNNGFAVVGWTALKHKGVIQITETFVPSVPPPTSGKPASIDMTLTAGSVITVKDSNGVILWSGVA